jgi:Prokaryotic E2 family A/Prokaryotic homologs of the JAB domain/ThiF family
MAEEYFEYPANCKSVMSELLRLEKSKKIAAYFSKSKFIEELNFYVFEKGGVVVAEVITFALLCDSVPPNNSVGILYRERLALEISNDNSLLVKVLALRKTFPALPHQNYTRSGYPKDLCLYFEPADVVNRTWTAPSLLARIVNWIVKSSLGILHTEDQPLENQFFDSPCELVLPWDFQQKVIQGKTGRLTIEDVRNKGGRTETYIVGESASSGFKSFQVVTLVTSKLLSGHINLHPSTLGEMHDFLASKSVDFHKLLRESLIQLVDHGYTPSEEEITFFLLHIPLCRDLHLEPEKSQTIGLICQKNIGQIGEALGFLNRGVNQNDNNKYFQTRIIGCVPPPVNAELWRELKLSPVSVLFKNGPTQSRLQSGLTTEGPKGIIIGVGSLGSTILELWVRSGWGRWTIIDCDHLKPHNLSRHVATSEHIGVSKVKAMAAIANSISGDSNPVVPIDIDASQLFMGQYEAELNEASIILDFSTSLTFPRASSIKPSIARSLSAFITPNSKFGVILTEDAKRQCSLLTAEAQYYRAMISSDWGENHLIGNNGKFWSGASCRDASLVMPYSRISLFASLISEKIQKIVDNPIGEIVIFEHLELSNEVKTYQYEVRQEISIPRDNFVVAYDEGLVEKLMEMRLENLPNETGGSLLGYHDFNIGRIVIVDALPAPTDSISDSKSFTRGVEGQVELLKDIDNKTAGIVGYIGEWHSHPAGGSSYPSKDDIIQLCALSAKLAEDGLPALQVIVSSDELRPIVAEYQSDTWIIKGSSR